MYNLALFSSINFVPYERKLTQKESFQTTYVRRTSMQKTINCVIPKRLFGLLLNCWLETQSTLAVFGENYYHSKTLVFFADFCSYFTLDQIRMNHNDPHFSVFWYQPPPGGKVHTFWEGHNILRNLHLNFDWHCIGQKYGGDFAKVFGLLRIYELYWVGTLWCGTLHDVCLP